MRGHTWAALVFMEVVQLRVKFTWMSGPEIDHMMTVIHLLSSDFESSGQFRSRAVNVAEQKYWKQEHEGCVTFPKILLEPIIAGMLEIQKSNLCKELIWIIKKT